MCAIGFNSHVLQPLFVTIVPATRVLCGPSLINATQYTLFYFRTWPILQICVNVLAPTILMILFLLLIYRKVRTVGRVRQNQHLQNQMLILMLSKTILFLICTLCDGVYNLTLVSSIQSNSTTGNSYRLILNAILVILLNLNYSIAFYVHCLTSTLFRKTFFKLIQRQGHLQNRVHPITHSNILTHRPVQS